MSTNSVSEDKHNAFSHQSEVKNHKGYLWRIWMQNVPILADAHHYMSIQIGNKPIRINKITFATDAITSRINFYEGGAISGGTPADSESMNLDNINPIIDLVSLTGVTIDTPGTLILPQIIRGSASFLGSVEVIHGDNGVGIILARNKLYYMDIWNIDTQSRDFDFYFDAHIWVDD